MGNIHIGLVSKINPVVVKKAEVLCTVSLNLIETPEVLKWQNSWTLAYSIIHSINIQFLGTQTANNIVN